MSIYKDKVTDIEETKRLAARFRAARYKVLSAKHEAQEERDRLWLRNTLTSIVVHWEVAPSVVSEQLVLSMQCGGE